MRILLLWLASLSALDTERPIAVNGLRVLLGFEGDAQKRVLVITFENVQERREMFLSLGTVGTGMPEFLELDLIGRSGVRHLLQFMGNTSPAPSRFVPRVIPLLPRSTYSLRTPLRFWRGTRPESMDLQFAQGAWLQVRLNAADSMPTQFVNCFGLQIFWHGEVFSNRLHT